MHWRKALKIELKVNFTSVENWEKGSSSIFLEYENVFEESEFRTKQEFGWQKKQ